MNKPPSREAQLRAMREANYEAAQEKMKTVPKPMGKIAKKRGRKAKPK